MASANRYLEQVYMARHNAEFSVKPAAQGTAFIPHLGGRLPDILMELLAIRLSQQTTLAKSLVMCEQHERIVGNDNCVSFGGMKLQIPADGARHHYVRVRVRVHCYVDGTLGVFHGPRKLAGYDAQGNLPQQELKQAA